MIRCTGVNAALSVIPFQSEMEKVAGFALGTADLLGQMAAEDYVDKLPILYAEFAEAAALLQGPNPFHRHVFQRGGLDAEDPGVLGEVCPGEAGPRFRRPASVSE